jgi:hypothetical protein
MPIESEKPSVRETNAAEDIEVGILRPEDAAGVVSLVKSVYGDGYPVRVFYDADALVQANAAREYLSIVAKTRSGKVVGVMNLFSSAPHPALYESGAGMVMKEYRKLGIGARLGDYLYRVWAPAQDFIDALFGEPVCNHLVMQKQVEEHKFVETALEVALMPAAAYGKEASASGRVATLLAFRSRKPRPHAAFLPPQYEDALRYIYSDFDDHRDLMVSAAETPPDSSSDCKMTVFDFAQVARIAVSRIGADFESSLTSLESQALEQGVLVNQLWLNLSFPWVGQAVDIVRKKGYFFGGALPRWFNDDGMLMQKVLCDPNFGEIQIYSDRARRITDFVKKDYIRAQSLKAED